MILFGLVTQRSEYPTHNRSVVSSNLTQPIYGTEADGISSRVYTSVFVGSSPTRPTFKGDL